MPQLVLLLKRKPGMSKEAFKAHYEAHHARMAAEWMGHAMQDYRRYYVETQSGLDAFWGAADEPAYDAVTVITFESDAQLEEFQRAGTSHHDEFIADEHRFLDRKQVLVFTTAQEITALPGKSSF